MGELPTHIGNFYFRDFTAKSFLPSMPIYKTATPKVAKNICENCAELLVECLRDNENAKRGAGNVGNGKTADENATENTA